MALAWKQTYGSMEQNREPRNKPTQLRSGNLQQMRQEHTMGKSLLSKWYWGNWTATCIPQQWEHSLSSYRKINNVAYRFEHQTGHHKTFRTDHRQTIIWHTSYQCFLKSGSQGNRNKNKNKWALIKTFCTAKETISKMKRHPWEWEKIVANEATDKGLITIICKKLVQLHFKNRQPNPKIGT